MKKKHIRGLDGLRGISVLIVIAAHTGLFEYLPKGARSIFSGRTGVEVFFVLSGYLITHLLIIEKERTKTISLKKFYLRRALRILPAYWALLILVTAVFLFGFIGIPTVSLALAWLHSYNFVPQEFFTGVLAHTWSLAVEEHFYLIWPIVLSICLRHSRRACVIAGASWLMLCVGFGFYAFSPSDSGYFLSWWTIPSSGGIAVGATIAILTGLPSSGTGSANGNIPLPFLILAFLSTAFLIVDCTLEADLRASSGAYRSALHWARCAAIGALILFVVRAHGSNPAVRILEFPPLRWLGKISYGVYLWQGFFLTTGPRTSADQTWPLHPLLAVALTFVFATLSYYLLEKRFLRLKKRF